MNISKAKTENKSELFGISAHKFQNYIEITVLFAIAAIPLVFAPLGDESDYFYLPKVLAMIIIVLFFSIIYILNIKTIGNLVETDWINKILLIFLLMRIISVFFAEDIDRAIYGSPGRVEGLITIIIYMCLFLIARSLTKLNDKFFLIIMGTAMIVSIYGICQYIGIDPLPPDAFKGFLGRRPYSTIGNANFLGSYLVLMIPVSLYLFVIRNLKIGFLFYGVMLYCLLSTNTRGTWLGAMASIICFATLHFILYRYKREEFFRYIILFVVSIIILMLFNLQTDGVFTRRFVSIAIEGKNLLAGSGYSENVGANRGFIWKRVIELIMKRPLFGYGLENLGIAFEKNYSAEIIEVWGTYINIDKAHNEYLHIAVTSGIPSLIAYLSFVVLILRNGWQKIREDKHMLLLISCIFGYLAAANFNISVVSVAYIFWIFLGFIAGQKSKLPIDNNPNLNET